MGARAWKTSFSGGVGTATAATIAPAPTTTTGNPVSRSRLVNVIIVSRFGRIGLSNRLLHHRGQGLDLRVPAAGEMVLRTAQALRPLRRDLLAAHLNGLAHRREDQDLVQSGPVLGLFRELDHLGDRQR